MIARPTKQVINRMSRKTLRVKPSVPTSLTRERQQETKSFALRPFHHLTPRSSATPMGMDSQSRFFAYPAITDLSIEIPTDNPDGTFRKKTQNRRERIKHNSSFVVETRTRNRTVDRNKRQNLPTKTPASTRNNHRQRIAIRGIVASFASPSPHVGHSWIQQNSTAAIENQQSRAAQTPKRKDARPIAKAVREQNGSPTSLRT